MLFDFDKFSRIATSVYPGGAYSLEETLNVFRYFFEKYEEVRGEPHPPIRASQIVHIMLDMPYVEQRDRCGSIADIDPDCYPVLIDKYFQTPFKNCNYRINHFFSGRIRELRFFEELF